MQSALLISELLSTPLALMRERVEVLGSVLAGWAVNGIPAVAGGPLAAGAARPARGDAGRIGGAGVAVLPLHGVISQRGDMFDAIFNGGSVSAEAFTYAFRQAMADSAVSAILIEIDSPGGSIYGVGELAEEIFAARGKKPMVAIANSLAASAAYWIGCAADQFYMTPGGDVGSIGVWTAHQDFSKYLDELGVKTTLISAGKYKTEQNRFEPLGTDAKQFLQSRIDEAYSTFTRFVAKGRGVSLETARNGMGAGRVLGARQAPAERLVDGIATFDQVAARLGVRGKVAMEVRARNEYIERLEEIERYEAGQRIAETVRLARAHSAAPVVRKKA